jgi:general secretion pathway protein F
MPEFAYQAMDSAGARARGTLSAASRATAMEQLEGRGLFVTHIEEEKSAEEGERRRWALPFVPVVSSNELTLMVRRLATLIGAGIPLVESLKALSTQVESPAFRHILSEVKEEVQRGQPLSRAFSHHPHVFPEIMVAMVQVGETGGILSTVLEQLADFSERDREIRSEVLSAMAYPVLVLVLAIATVGVLMTTVVPKIGLMFAGSKVLLPTPTVVLLAVSGFFKSYVLYILGVVVVAGIAFLRYVRTERGRLAFDSAKLQLPLIGKLTRRTAIARFSRSLGALVRGGVPLMEALNVVKRVLNSAAMTRAIERMQERVRKGDPMARGLRDEPLFPEMVRYMIGTGEDSGHLDEMLFKIAEVYEMETRNAVKVALSLLSPILLLLVALLVGFIAFSLLLPIFRLSQTIG